MEQSQLFKFAYFRSYDTTIADLASLANPEPWSFSNESPSNYSILKNYLEHTFRRIRFENKIVSSHTSHSTSYVSFNTGLMTHNYSYIYAFFEPNRNPGAANPFYFKSFFTESDISKISLFPSLPLPVDFFQDPSLLVYNHHLPLQLNTDHIVDENIERFPSAIQQDKDLCRRSLKGAVQETQKRLLSNYKLAVPHCYQNKVQLLVPIYLLGHTDTPDLALAIENNKDRYYAITCLTMRMAYQNARLIVRPESSWLRP